jgi:hypothetical protein
LRLALNLARVVEAQRVRAGANRLGKGHGVISALSSEATLLTGLLSRVTRINFSFSELN